MKNVFLIIWAMAIVTVANAQGFEKSYSFGEETEKPAVKVGADFAMQYQGLSHHADTARLIPLGKGITLPTANFNLDANLADGITVNLTTYLSSRHHNDTWVKGGYLFVDKLPFIKSPAITKIMDYISFRAGVMELNYGDYHFRRTDNGNAIRNPFVGNNIIEGFSVSPAFEAYFNASGFLLMGGLTTGTVNASLSGYNAATRQYTAYNAGKELAFYGKIGYDKQLNDNLRFRLTLSGYHSSKNHSGSLYFGDRAGSRFYLVMQRTTNSASDVDPSANFTTGNWGPGTTNKDNSGMINLFVKYYGAELFGTLEKLKGTTPNGTKFDFNQFAIEGIYRFGNDENFFAGIKYNTAGNDTPAAINRLETSIGWFPLKSLVIKAEYVDQNYKHFDVYGGNAGFNGVMIESAISF
ncbi:MAG TPA: hypothetical protein VHO46_00380 [Bacteroidales bacterium]|nr:hypothetical protein [Bacteroidales bacterium]